LVSATVDSVGKWGTVHPRARRTGHFKEADISLYVECSSSEMNLKGKALMSRQSRCVALSSKQLL